MNEQQLDNIIRFNEILRLYDGMIFDSSLFFQRFFPTNISENPFKGKIIFRDLFIGDYLQTDIENECILNFASAKHPGGGILRGSTAQEEDICRNSLLYLALRTFNQSHYLSGLFQNRKYYEDFIIYSDNIPTIRRDLTMGRNNNYITCAAPNLNGLNDIDTELLQQILTKRIKGIFTVAYENKCKKIVLGPWGCGVFKNDPNQMALIFDIAISMFGGHFDQITFLVPDKTIGEIFKKHIYHAL